MTTITIDRAVAQQMLGMLLKVEAELKTYYTTETEEVRALYASITALRSALAQQAEQQPMHPELRKMWEDHIDKCFRAIPVPEQAEPVQEPVGRVVSANCEYATVQWLKQTSDVGGGDPQNSRSWPIAGDAVYTAPPQRKPLTEEEIAAEWRKASEFAGKSEGAVTTSQFVQIFARAIERAHGIREGA